MKIKKFLSLVLGFVLVSSMFIGCGQKSETTTTKSNEEKKSLFVYCGAGLNKPMEEIGQSFEKKYGVKIEYTYAMLQIS